ncbi:MAG TPA: LytTR family DNA-binding domain-containing protein [Gemmatimonadales bacterium]|nr:LytTR family DNA-binding domain-containing protein [Gemmatimonadales bacterium]
MTLRVVLVDDEPLARAALAAILEDQPDVEIAGESASAADAVRVVRTLEPDLVFLDIALPDHDGFWVLEQLAGRQPAIVFVTAHSDRAVKAFEVRALDYVTKPLRRHRVEEAVARARERTSPPPDGRRAAGGPLTLKTDGTLRLIDQDTIDWIAADDDHIVVHASGGRWRARETLQEVERRLDPRRFVRIHRSTVVRLNRVRELQPWFHGDYVAILHTGAKLRVSRTYRERVARFLGRDL